MTDLRHEGTGQVKPILFNTDMVLAILDGRKTATRRVVKPIPPENARLEFFGDRRHAMDLSIEIPGPNDRRIYTPPYIPGNILYVRETWARNPFGEGFIYPTDHPGAGQKWRPSIHMPKEAARIFLRVTDLRVERLQEIDGAGIKAEGTSGRFGATRGAFIDLWNSTVKRTERHQYGYRANPWVWVISFERCEKPEGWPWSE